MIRRILQWRPSVVFASAAILIALIAIIDWRVEFNATLGFLYIFPMVLLGTIVGWWPLVLIAIFCTYLSRPVGSISNGFGICARRTDLPHAGNHGLSFPGCDQGISQRGGEPGASGKRGRGAQGGGRAIGISHPEQPGLRCSR